MALKRRHNYIVVLPSLFTTGNLFCGYFCILRSFAHDFERAAFAIIAAGIFDVLDGRVARITRSTSKFGVEYDSIADVVSFGVAPAVLAYVWALEPMGRLGWAASFFFAACGALRLARFNTISDELPKSYFLGLPIPAAANMIAASYIAYHEIAFKYVSEIIVVACFLLGLCMVSSVRYRSFKDFDLRHRRSFFQMVLVLMVITLIVVRAEVSLAVIIGGYVLWGPIREIITWIRHPTDRKTFVPEFVSGTSSQEEGSKES